MRSALWDAGYTVTCAQKHVITRRFPHWCHKRVGHHALTDCPVPGGLPGRTRALLMTWSAAFRRDSCGVVQMSQKDRFISVISHILFRHLIHWNGIFQLLTLCFLFTHEYIYKRGAPVGSWSTRITKFWVINCVFLKMGIMELVAHECRFL